MTPYINGLIVQHEERFAYSFPAVEVYSVASLNELIVNDVVWSFLYVTNESFQFLLRSFSNVLELVHPVLQPLIMMQVAIMTFLFLIIIFTFILKSTEGMIFRFLRSLRLLRVTYFKIQKSYQRIFLSRNDSSRHSKSWNNSNVYTTLVVPLLTYLCKRLI